METLNAAEALHPWLRLTTSLTQKLQHSFATKPGLSLLGEGLEHGNIWERELLSAQQNVYARHIALTIGYACRAGQIGDDSRFGYGCADPFEDSSAGGTTV